MTKNFDPSTVKSDFLDSLPKRNYPTLADVIVGTTSDDMTDSFKKLKRAMDEFSAMAKVLYGPEISSLKDGETSSPPPLEPNWATDPLGISDWLNDAWFDLRLRFYSAVDSAAMGLCDIGSVVSDIGYSVEEWAQDRINEL